MRFWVGAGIVVLALGVLGCGPANPLGRIPLSGAVTLDGKPLEKGNIEFHPLEQAGVQSGGKIQSGRYSIPTAEGATPGKYRVVITEFIETPPLPKGQMPGDDLPPAPKPRIGPEWNDKSKHEIEVKKEGPFKFDFDVKSKK
jgi:hypothetical protein